MNGEPTTYRINAPMSWAEFTEMPDDLKVMYIEWIREEFQAPDSAIADMLGIHRTHLSRVLRAVGVGPTGRAPKAKWDKEGFAAWAGIEEKAKSEPQDVIEDAPVDDVSDLFEEVVKAPTRPFIHEEIEPEDDLIPTAGWMNFEGPADQALRAIGNVLGNANVRLHVSWNPINTEDTQDGGH